MSEKGMNLSRKVLFWFLFLVCTLLTPNAENSVNFTFILLIRITQTHAFTGAGRIGTDEAEFNRILSCYSYQLLRIVFEEYKKIKGKSFGDALDSELSGDIKIGMRAICKCPVVF